MFKLYTVILFLCVLYYIISNEYRDVLKINNEYKIIKQNKTCNVYLDKLYKRVLWRLSFIFSAIGVVILLLSLYSTDLLPPKNLNIMLSIFFMVNYIIISSSLGFFQWHYIIDASI